MGRHYVNKLLLLDEHDLARASPAATFADFVPAAEAFWKDGFAWSEFPECKLIGVAAERFDDAILRDGNYAEPTWLRQAGWTTNLAGAVGWALSDIPQRPPGLPEPGVRHRSSRPSRDRVCVGLTRRP